MITDHHNRWVEGKGHRQAAGITTDRHQEAIMVVVNTVTLREVEVIAEEDDHEVVVQNAEDTHRGRATS